MKQVKLIIAIIAVVASFASAFKPHTKFTMGTFSYVSGDLTNPTSYIASTGICGHGTVKMCAIGVEWGFNGYPDDTSLDALYAESSHFSIPGTWPHGFVHYKN